MHVVKKAFIKFRKTYEPGTEIEPVDIGLSQEDVSTLEKSGVVAEKASQKASEDQPKKKSSKKKSSK